MAKELSAFTVEIRGELLSALSEYIANTEKQKGIPVDPQRIVHTLLWAALEKR